MKCVYQPPAGQYIFPKPVKGRIVFSSKISILNPLRAESLAPSGDSFGCSDYFRLTVLAASGAGGVLAASGAGGTLGEAWPG